MNSHRSMRELLDVVWSRRLLVVGLALGGLCAAILLSFFLPRMYESAAEVRVVDNHALYDVYGRAPAGAKDPEERARLIGEELLSRENVTEVVESLISDGEGFEGEGSPDRQALVTGIRENTRVERVEADPGVFRFRISHGSEDPALSVRVVTRLATGYRNRRAQGQTRTAARELADVRTELREAGEELDRITSDLVSFETKHADQRFGVADEVPARLTDARERQEEFQLQVETLRQQLEDFSSQLAEEPKFLEVVEEQANREKVLQIEEEVRAARSRLEDLTRIYPDAHRDVIAQRGRVERLEGELAKARVEKQEVVRKVPNETWARLQEAVLRVRSELKVRERSLEVAEAKVVELSKLGSEWPVLNARWKELVATREHLQSRILGLQDKKEAAELVWTTKAAESAIVFDVLDRPTRPSGPSSPNRTLIASLGLLLGFGIGVVSVLVRDLLDRSFRHTEEVAASFDVPVLGNIARIETLAEREQAKQKRRMAAVGVVALALVAGAAVFAQMRYDGMISSFIRETIDLAK